MAHWPFVPGFESGNTANPCRFDERKGAEIGHILGP